MAHVNSTEFLSYYGPIVVQHVQTILGSGLLLDEDYEVLLKASDFKIYPIKPAKLPLALIGSVLATVGSVFVAARYDLRVAVVPSLTLTLAWLCLERRAARKRKRRRDVGSYLVQRLIRVQKLNSAVVRYVAARNELSSKQESLLLDVKNVEEFLKLFVNKNRDFFKIVLSELKCFSVKTSELSNDFEGMKEINVDAILTTDKLSVNDSSIVALKVNDMNTLLSSKFLNYLGITLCNSLNNSNTCELECLLDEKLAGINATLDELYGALRQEFNNLRYCTSKKVEIDGKNKRPFARHVSGKLQQTLVGAVNNLSIIMERSRAVLQKMESADSGNDIKNLESALGDLRDHAFATYESLDVLCKLYGILSNANKIENSVKKPENAAIKDGLSENREIVHFDDPSEPLEENYELFIAKNEQDLSEEGITYEDPSSAYLGLMLKELQHSLKQHERFVAARTKRGIKDDNEEKTQHIRRKKSPPRFMNDQGFILPSSSDVPKFLPPSPDLSNMPAQSGSPKLPPSPPPPPLPPSSSSPLNIDLTSTMNNLELKLLSPKLPPPPPPPPSFDLTSLGSDGIIESRKSFFDNIKTLSSQLRSKEDVFGDEEHSSDSD